MADKRSKIGTQAGGDRMITPEQRTKLESLAEQPRPVIAAHTALVHAERGYGCPAPDELQAVLAALDEWTSGDRKVIAAQAVDPAYGRVVTALTVFDIRLRREIGL